MITNHPWNQQLNSHMTIQIYQLSKGTKMTIEEKINYVADERIEELERDNLALDLGYSEEDIESRKLAIIKELSTMTDEELEIEYEAYL